MATNITTPVLDLNMLDTHSGKTIAFADTSRYPEGWTTTSPSIQITVPNFDVVTLDFTPSSIQVFSSSDLGISCEWDPTIDLPDGIWKVKYSIYPAYKYYVEKTFVRVDKLQAKLDKYYLTLDFMQCDEQIKREDELILDSIQTFIEGAVAAGNNCVLSLFNKLYKKASTMLDDYINNKSCVRQ